MTQAEPVLLGLSRDDAVDILTWLDAAIEELEQFEVFWVGDDEAKVDFWHVHGAFSGLADTLREWLGPLYAGGLLPSGESGPGLGSPSPKV